MLSLTSKGIIMSKILLSIAAVAISITAYAAGIGDCVEVPSKVIGGKLTTLKTVLAYTAPDGVKPVRQISWAPAMLVKKMNGYILLANVPDDTQDSKACYKLGWVREADVKVTGLMNCSFYSNICEGGE